MADGGREGLSVGTWVAVITLGITLAGVVYTMGFNTGRGNFEQVREQRDTLVEERNELRDLLAGQGEFPDEPSEPAEPTGEPYQPEGTRSSESNETDEQIEEPSPAPSSSGEPPTPPPAAGPVVRQDRLELAAETPWDFDTWSFEGEPDLFWRRSSTDSTEAHFPLLGYSTMALIDSPPSYELCRDETSYSGLSFSLNVGSAICLRTTEDAYAGIVFTAIGERTAIFDVIVWR